MAHEGNTKIWAKIISTRAPNAATKNQNFRKIVIFPSIPEDHPTGTALGDASHGDMAKHAARDNNQAAGTTSVKEFIFPQTSAET